MQYQSFRGADVKEALSRVRAQLGPDALIQSTRSVNNGRTGALGNSWVEVTAALPTERMAWPFGGGATGSAAASLSAGGRTQPAERRPGGVQPTSRPRTPTLGLDPAQLQRELDCLHAMLEELNAARPPRERALALLAAAGIEGALARQLAVGASRVARRGVPALVAWLMDRVSSVLCIDEDPLLAPGSQAIFCVGNTGVGKTTTLAKLAARARLDLGRSVAVISLDSFRVGAVEQWQRYASLMGIPLHTATTTEELSRRIAESRAEICLIDTTGKSSTTSDAWVALPERDELGQRSVRVLLVMPAWLRGRDAERTHEQYRDAGITGITISKLDETCQLGGVLQAAIPNRIPITYLCDGPRVPEDIQSARSELIVQALFSECT